MLHYYVFKHTDHAFHKLENHWEGQRGQKLLGNGLVLSFLLALITIELNRLGFLPQTISQRLSTNHLVAIEFAFTLLLVFEVISLIFSLSKSVANSVGKQFEILSLILLRDTFKELSHLAEPIEWEAASHTLTAIIPAAIGALLIFVILGFYYRSQQHKPITEDQADKISFIAAKKVIALALLFSFIVIGIFNVWNSWQKIPTVSVFESFYTILIFSDVLIVLLSLRYSAGYHVAFRNSGFAVSTVFIRLALLAPIFIGALLGAGTALFALGVTVAYNKFAPIIYQIHNHQEPPLYQY